MPCSLLPIYLNRWFRHNLDHKLPTVWSSDYWTNLFFQTSTFWLHKILINDYECFFYVIPKLGDVMPLEVYLIVRSNRQSNFRRVSYCRDPSGYTDPSASLWITHPYILKINAQNMVSVPFFGWNWSYGNGLRIEWLTTIWNINCIILGIDFTYRVDIWNQMGCFGVFSVKWHKRNGSLQLKATSNKYWQSQRVLPKRIIIC